MPDWELCRAKVNLTLHVGATMEQGKWAGYHPVESLVVFADFGDRLRLAPPMDMGLSVGFEGPFGDQLEDIGDSSVHQAMRLCGRDIGRAVVEKNLPVASGLGGGTADAAGVLRLLDPDRTIDPVKIGADGHVCWYSNTAMMEGIGERVTPMPGLGQLHAVIANPGVAISTGEIFRAFDADERKAEPTQTSRMGSLLLRALSGSNELQPIAIAQAPVIADLLEAIGQSDGCRLARMSGSGASCFGIFASKETAIDAAAKLTRDHGWWARACLLGEAG